MILSRVTIENYKHYTGPVEIDVPSQATVGVIGENGAGKTTLFEAIEWCLYAPRSISPSDVRPRNFTGPTTVTVYLESVDGESRYIVERVLKRTPSATVYRVDTEGELETVVQGPRQVTDYVTTNLVGLSHTAFTATFFTRQKELHLFGDQTPGKRREEVGRLLGLETIRIAQRSFVTERSKTAAEAKAMLTQYERESQGRDLVQELAVAEGEIAQATSDAEAAGTASKSAEQDRKAAETASARAQARRDSDLGFANAQHQLEAERNALETRSAAITADLTRITAREAERATLAERAGRLPDLLAEESRLKAEQERYQRARELDRAQREIDQARRNLNGTLRTTVHEISLSRQIDGWVWSTDDALNPVDGATRLLAILDGIDVAAAEARHRHLQRAAEAAARLEEERKKLAKFEDIRRKIDAEEQAHLANGDPRDRISQIDRDREKRLAERSLLQAARTALEGDRDKTTLLIGNLEKAQFGDICPTCGRPFTDSDANDVAAILREKVASINSELQQNALATKRVAIAIEQLDADRQLVFKQMDALDGVRKRIANSIGVLEGQRETTNAAEAALAEALAQLGADRAPQNGDLHHAQIVVTELRTVLATRHFVMNALNNFEVFHRDEQVSLQARVELGEVQFDQSEFDRLQSAIREADRAQSSITQIDHDVARRPGLETEHATITARLWKVRSELDEIGRQRIELGYQESELNEAQRAFAEAQERERLAMAAFVRSQGKIREAELRRDAVTREQERLKLLAAAADAKRAEADHLDLMTREMTEFERFAAARKVPVLGDYTSALVRAITDGRYDRVEFDQDFGIVVFDGDNADSSYPVDTFSGGERDAITLAARIALSQMIGRQAANPPGFLVLDEVFGSLDSDRRSQLLDLLGTISGIFDRLRQVFIISHVDDVRTSPVLDELWRVEHTGDGSSQVSILPSGAEIDTL
jgi:exonuclease SbcC